MPELIEKTKPSIVKIISFDELGYESGGTGFFIDSAGTCVTNHFVLANSSSVYIETLDSIKYQIDEIINQSKNSDLVRFSLKNTEERKFSYLKLAGTKPKVGEEVFMISHPKGYTYSVSTGEIAAYRSMKTHGEVLQTTVPSSDGSSGAPLMNMHGEVVGIMFLVKFTGQNLNFAIDVSQLKNLGNDSTLERDYYEKLSLNSNQIDSIISLSQTYIQVKKYDRVLDHLLPLLKYVQSAVQGAKINNNIAIAYFFKEDYVNAHRFYDRVLKWIDQAEKTPEMVSIYAKALHHAGLSQFYLGITKDCIETLDHAVWVAKQGLANDSTRKELYTEYLQLFYYTLAIVHLSNNDTSDACIN